LNNKHTIFGKVVEGTDVVMNINNVKTLQPGVLDKPATPVKLISVTIKREGPAPAVTAPVKKSTTPTKSATPVKK
jgi:hypothetical protein